MPVPRNPERAVDQQKAVEDDDDALRPIHIEERLRALEIISFISGNKAATTAMIQSHAEGGLKMGSVSSIVRQIKEERDRVAKQLSGMDAALTAFAGVYSNGQPKKRRKMSLAARKRIAAAQRRRWANVRAAK